LEDESSLRDGVEKDDNDFLPWEARERGPWLVLPLSCMPRYEVMTLEDVARVKPAKMPTAAAVASYEE
jgi:hypothetical protein